MTRLFAPLALLALAACSGSYRDASVPMTSMAVFDAERYAGRWYEVASFPTPFQAGCAQTTADYTLSGPETLSVRNACIKPDGPSEIEGTARLSGPGRLKVNLDGVPVTADYWILWIDEGYRTAVVGVPSGRAGWILNRDPQIPPDRLRAAREVLAFNGYDLSRLAMTPQEPRP